MPIEAATYITDLQPSNPAGSDPVADGDNHIRLLKQVLKNTFPSLSGPFPLTNAQLAGVCPQRSIIMWSGAVSEIPSGWTLCNGATVAATTSSGTITPPDLRDRFVVGAGSKYSVGATGGAESWSASTSAAGGHFHFASTDSQGSHNHTGSVAGTVLTTDQMPAHNHDLGFSIIGIQGVPLGGPLAVFQASGSNQTTGARGSGVAHAHSIVSDGTHAHNVTVQQVGDHAHTVSGPSLPPYFALCFIMKT